MIEQYVVVFSWKHAAKVVNFSDMNKYWIEKVIMDFLADGIARARLVAG